MESVKIYVSKDDSAIVICPFCQKRTKISVAKYRGIKATVKVKCVCKKVFGASFDFRQNYRRETNLVGKYRDLKGMGPWRDMIVQNISMTGLGFSDTATHYLKKGDKVVIRFHLDDAHNSFVEKEAFVVNVDDDFIGCEFTQAKAYEKELGFYLMP